MERSRQLFRDFGLTLALLLAAAVILWKTTLPQIERIHRLDRRLDELKDEQARTREETERLEARELAVGDPIENERAHRALFGAQGLPANEVLVPVETSRTRKAAERSSASER